MKTLTVKLEKPNPEIIQKWSTRDKEAIHSHCGLKYPNHHDLKDVVAKKCKDFSEPQDYKTLAVELLKMQKYVGAEAHGKDENDRLMNFVVKEFPDFNFRDISTAIDCSVAPDNPLNLAPRKTEYVNFNAEYLSRILTPYRQYRSRLVNLHTDMLVAAQVFSDKTEPSTLTEEQTLDFEIKFCTQAFESFAAKLPVAGLDRIFDVMHKHKLLKFTPEQLKQFKTVAVENLQKQARSDGRVKSTMQAFAKGMEVGVATVETETKKLAMIAFFSNMIEQEVTPKLLFEPLKAVFLEKSGKKPEKAAKAKK